MKITELIKRLESHLLVYGDADVEVRNRAGEFDVVSDVEAIPYGMPNDIKWRYFIET